MEVGVLARPFSESEATPIQAYRVWNDPTVSTGGLPRTRGLRGLTQGNSRAAHSNSSARWKSAGLEAALCAVSRVMIPSR